jgi:hypothetical protein
MFGHNPPKDVREERREEGSAFLIVVLLTLVVAALGTPMLVMSNTAHQIAANERDAERALFASKAGLNYGYYLYEQGTLAPTTTGASFDSFATAIATPLSDESFTGKIYDISAVMGRGQLYRIESIGTYGHSNRKTEILFEVVPEAMKYGYMAFSEATLHNHSGLAGPTFKIESTIFSNGVVNVPLGLTIDGTIVSLNLVTTLAGSTVKGDIFANALANAGTVIGNATMITAVTKLPDTAVTWNRVDSLGNKYNWFNGKSTPGTVTGAGTVTGTTSSYAVANGDEFKYSIFRHNGSLTSTPDINVGEYISPPLLDYKAMKTEADRFDATYFSSMSAAMTYLSGKKVIETINGKTVKTIKVGTTSAPEFLYVRGNFTLKLVGASGVENTANGVLAADGFNLEGGMYVSGDWSFNGPEYKAANHPAPPDWYQLRINALPYCLPAIIAYPEPSSGSIATWTPANTPAMLGSVDKITMSSNPTSPALNEGFAFINGSTLSEGETHLHHTKNASELIRFVGAELAYKVHNCDYIWFTYDPDVRCTKFLATAAGVPQVVSYREIR